MYLLLILLHATSQINKNIKKYRKHKKEFFRHDHLDLYIGCRIIIWQQRPWQVFSIKNAPIYRHVSERDEILFFMGKWKKQVRLIKYIWQRMFRFLLRYWENFILITRLTRSLMKYLRNIIPFCLRSRPITPNVIRSLVL